MKIELHIEKLILDGIAVDGLDHAQLQSAVETELAGLIAAGGIRRELSHGAALPALRGNEIRISSETTSATLGSAIARTVGSSIADPAMNKTTGTASSHINSLRSTTPRK